MIKKIVLNYFKIYKTFKKKETNKICLKMSFQFKIIKKTKIQMIKII